MAPQQVQAVLEAAFREDPYPNPAALAALAQQVGAPAPAQVRWAGF